MHATIYGREGCVNCDRAKMLCQMKSIEFDYLVYDKDYTHEELEAKLGSNLVGLPQIFLVEEGQEQLVGGYQELRQAIQ